MENKTEILSPDELLDLKKELRSSYITAMTLFLMFMAFVHLLVFIKTEKWMLPNFEVILIIGSMTVTYLASYFLTRELRGEIKDGLKTIELKIIESKYDFMDKQDRLSSEFKKFVIIASGKEYIVTEGEYIKAEVSGYLSIHLSPKRKKIINLEVI